MSTLYHFDKYTDLGLNVIAIHCNSKIPMLLNWNIDFSSAANRELVENHANCNLGLVLGDIVDVEGDSCAANEYLLNIIGDYPHPTYQSDRSIHHLFQSPDPLCTILKHRNIEFRGRGHQSVIPPSTHSGGKIYRWVDEVFPVPEMPPSLLDLYNKCRIQYSLKPNHTKVLCGKCRVEFFRHKKRLKLERIALNAMNLPWLCKSCSPVDLRPACRKIKKNYKFHSKSKF